MYKICICDDEPLHRSKLEHVLIEYSVHTNRDFKIDQFESPKQLLEATNNYDIIFLDIDFPNDERGTQVGREMRQDGLQSIIVFLTAYQQYSIEGYEAEAFRYLLKPITSETATQVLNAVFAKWEQKSTYISIKASGGTMLLDSSQITMIVADGRKQKAFCSDNVIETWEPLKELSKRLPDWSFAYAHQGCIVNLQQVKQVIKDDIVMLDGTRVTLSRRQKTPFVRSISKMIEHTK